MNQKSVLKRIYIPILCLVTVLSVSLRVAAMLLDYDARIGYFNKKGIITAASVLVVCGSVLLFTYAFAGSKKEKLIATFTTPSTYVPSAILITALIFFATKSYIRIKDFEFAIPEGLSGADSIKYVTTNLSLYLTAILVPLAIFSAVYFILNATVANRYSVARAAFGICTVLFLALYASFLYFDTTLAINSPNKIVDQMAFIFAALFFLYEIRISLARECWHLYIAFGFVAATLGAYSSVPSLVMFFARDTVISHSVEESLLTLCITLFITSRLILASKLNPDKESEFVTAMRERADERNRYIVEKEEIERRAFIELYNRFSETLELPEEVNETELFEASAEAETPEAEAPESEVFEAEAPEAEASDIILTENAEAEATKCTEEDVAEPEAELVQESEAELVQEAEQSQESASEAEESQESANEAEAAEAETASCEAAEPTAQEAITEAADAEAQAVQGEAAEAEENPQADEPAEEAAENASDNTTEE